VPFMWSSSIAKLAEVKGFGARAAAFIASERAATFSAGAARAHAAEGLAILSMVDVPRYRAGGNW